MLSLSARYKLAEEATKLLEENGFTKFGRPRSKEEDEEQFDVDLVKETIFKKYGVIHEIRNDEEILQEFSGGFATRAVCPEELSFLINYDFRKNTLLVYSSQFEWMMHHLIAQRLLNSGYGIFHYKFVPKKGIYLAIYKLRPSEIETYIKNFYTVCEQLGMLRDDLSGTVRLYGIGEEEQRSYLPGKRYIVYSKKITENGRKTITGMFNKYQNEIESIIRLEAG